jgi:AcrR family transcriptional regulator
MIDLTTSKGRAVAAALRLAERKPWSEISLLDIADEAGLTLADLSKDFAAKSEVLVAFVRMADEAVLRKSERGEAGESQRERLFDVLMTRFETIAPYRAGLRRIAESPPVGGDLARAMLASQRWMLAAAGISADGVTGAARTAGLASVYAGVARVWLEDDDPGLSRTMAALDRRLRRGETWIGGFERVCDGMAGLFRRRRTAAPSPPSSPTPSASTDEAGPPPSVH